MDVPSGLLMRIKEDRMEVFLKNDNPESPYKVGGSDTLGHGLYCETVIGTNEELLVENALDDELWKDNPDVKLNMASYYGLPIQWPDHEIFGTICVLDDKTNSYNDDFKMLMNEFKLSIEKDLELLCVNKELKYFSEIDPLTTVYNRRVCNKILENEYARSLRTKLLYSVAILDLDQFKLINDTAGHDVGDKILKCFAKAIESRIRAVDSIGRWGGDEFILICPNTTKEGIGLLIQSINDSLIDKMKSIAPNADFSYGCAEYTPLDTDFDSIIKRADQNMYEQKKQKQIKRS